MSGTKTFPATLRRALLGLLVPLLMVTKAEGKIPALALVPTFFPSELKATYTERRNTLDAELKNFQSRADAFNTKPRGTAVRRRIRCALKAARADYVAKAEAYNKALYAAAIFYGQMEKMREEGKPVARAAETRGDFHIRLKDGREFSGAEALTIPLDGSVRIFTAKGARVQLLLPDETVFTIGENSDIFLSSFVYDPRTGVPSEMAGQITKGAFRWVTGKIQPHVAPIKLLFGVDAVGIRGTDFEMQFEPDGSGLLKLHAGIVDVTEKTTNRIVTLQPQQQVRFAASGALAPIEPLPAEVAAEN